MEKKYIIKVECDNCRSVISKIIDINSPFSICCECGNIIHIHSIKKYIIKVECDNCRSVISKIIDINSPFSICCECGNIIHIHSIKECGLNGKD